jgi:hypothetical protein
MCQCCVSVVCSVYLPYDSPSLPLGEKLRQVVNFSNEKGTPIVIGCDANSHHVAWASMDISSRGAAMSSNFLESWEQTNICKPC